jgi:hypothetical protein
LQVRSGTAASIRQRDFVILETEHPPAISICVSVAEFERQFWPIKIKSISLFIL